MRDTWPLYLKGEPVQLNTDLVVTDKYTGEEAARVALADPKTIDTAIAAASGAEATCASLAAWKRRAVLEHCVTRFRERFDELADALCVEAGKPIKDARGEVERLIDTFRIAAEESTRIVGEVLPLDVSERADGYRGMWKRVPIGACSFISPFNFPLNLVAHKVAPAIAVGCPFVLKPASRTPIGAIIIGEVLAETDYPKDAWSILPCSRDGAAAFTEDDRLKLLSFTGSDQVGWKLKARAGRKQVVLELGGNAACVVDQGVDLDDAVERMIVGAFYQSGQSCIGVQRIIVHESIYDTFRDMFVAKVQNLIAGNPKDPDTFIGPMISEGEAKRMKSWVDDAVSAGANLLCGGNRDGAMVDGTVLEDVDPTSDLYREEAFGPVAILEPFSTFDQAIERVNDSRFGLQAGVFTNDLRHMQDAWDHMDVGGVVINDVPSWRVDHMPYGGVKNSGIGREGIRFAIEDMTEIRLLVTRDVPR